MNKKVGIERCASYDIESVYKALKKAVELASDLNVAGKSVLLKPNILSDSAPEKAITTHPVFLEAAIRLIKEMGASKILVGDSPGIQGPGFIAKASGISDVIKKYDIPWVDFTKEKTEVSSPDLKSVKKFTVGKHGADIIISLPKLKTHQLMYYTGAIKNIFGLIPSIAKSTYHARYSSREAFASMLVDLCIAVKPDYAFLDAIIGMEGAGPAGGSPKQVGLIMASSNLLAIDVAATTVMGYPPHGVPVNKEALSRGIWLKDFNEIEYPGLNPKDLQIPNYVKVRIKRARSQFLDFILPKSLRKYRDSRIAGPEINHGTCVRCADCLKICSSKAMKIEGEGKERRVIIDYELCIRCFCCHEICPVKAIDIAKNPRNRVD
ncbi:MAG: DUF362 domain-containing protein [Treponema sp.]|nr:DUF362 domain-containing protein [Treponema sp.]